MSAGDPTTPLASWPGIASLLGALGAGGVITALINRFRTPTERQAAKAAAARDQAAGSAEVIEATASAFVEVTSGLREEIERLQQDVGRVQSDLAAAHERAVALESRVAELTRELERALAERDEAREAAKRANAKAEVLAGEVRQLQQLLDSMRKARATESETEESR